MRDAMQLLDPKYAEQRLRPWNNPVERATIMIAWLRDAQEMSADGQLRMTYAQRTRVKDAINMLNVVMLTGGES